MAVETLSFSPNWLERDPSNILVRLPNWLGDAVMATPILADLRSRYPKASITVMCQTNVSSLIACDPNINEIFAYKRPSGWIHRRHHLEIIESLKKGNYDLGILLTNSFSSAWWFWRGGVKNRLGFASFLRSIFLNKAVPFPKEKEIQHLVLTYKALLKPLGIPLSQTPPKLYLTENEIEDARLTLKKYGMTYGKDIIIGINPGAAYGTAKCWLPDRFIEITKKILELPHTYVIYFGDAAASPLIKTLAEPFSERVINMAAKTSLRELMALIHCCSAFLTNDSGPMHIAAALKTPLLALFGSTSEIKTGPYLKGRVIHKHVECSPCYKRVCPIDFRCMKRIEVSEVYNELMDILKENGQNKSL